MSDDHSANAISAYGSQINKTPNIDRLASEGMLFENCYVTNSICAPSRATILTGKYSCLNGVKDNHTPLDTSLITFPKLFRQNGYETAIIGKWHLKSRPTGFDYSCILPGQGNYYNPDFIENDKLVNYKGYSANLITQKGFEWLKKNKKKDEKPFLLLLQYKAPHKDWLTDIPYLDLYENITFPEPSTLWADHSGKSSAIKNHHLTIAKRLDAPRLHLIIPEKGRMDSIQKNKWIEAYSNSNKLFREAHLSGDSLTKWKYQRFVREYVKTVYAMDINIGKIMDFLAESGMDENTIVIYTSDQGFFLGEHGWYDKRIMYQAAFKTPLIVKWPGVVKPGSKNNSLVSNLDFAQTLLDIAGINSPNDMQGLSFKKILIGDQPKEWRKSHYYHYYQDTPPWGFPKHEGVFNGRFKLIHFYTTDEWEFYDLESDSLEINNIYGNDNYKDKVNYMKEELIRLKKTIQK